VGGLATQAVSAWALPAWLTTKAVLWGLLASVILGTGTWLYLHVKSIGAQENENKWVSVIEERNTQLEKVAKAATTAFDEADEARRNVRVEIVKEVEQIFVPVPVAGQPTPPPPAIPKSTIDKLNRIK